MWTIIADDLTGACDSGAAFALRGYPVRVAFRADAVFKSGSVRVITTESREMREEEAVQAVALAAMSLHQADSEPIYKKIDSTLRGHPGAELAVVMQDTGIDRALVAPAFPVQGRQVRNGQVWVYGARLEETEFARDRKRVNLLHLFGSCRGNCHGDCHGDCDGDCDGNSRGVFIDDIRQGIDRIVDLLQGPGVFVADAETEADLALLVQAAQRAGIHLLCGSAGLARALVESLPAGNAHLELQRQSMPVLVVAGSRSPVTLRQVEMARRAGLRVVSPIFDALRVASGEGVENLFVKSEAGVGIRNVIAGCFLKGEDVVISTGEIEHLAGKEASIAAALSALTLALLSSNQVGGLVLTGGQTAAAVFRSLDCTAFDLGGEIQPGIVWGRLANGSYADLTVVTKAGGFGDEQSLVKVVNALRES